MRDELDVRRRAAEADPSDPEAAVRLLRARARVEGRAAFLAVLEDRRRWQEAGAPLQDLAIEEAAQVLGPAFAKLRPERHECGGVAHRLGAFRHRPTGIELLLLPGGCFSMGSEENPIESPRHPVTLPPFLMGRTPVLQSQWTQAAGFNPSAFRGVERPMESVSWNAIQEWLERVGDGLRLPSESEWEYACRAGTETRYFWGDEIDPRRCWYDGNSRGQTRHLGEHAREANAFGLIDMSGNVWELCQDGYVPGYDDGPEDERARPSVRLQDALPWLFNSRIRRGGGWRSAEDELRSAARMRTFDNARSEDVGFRVARSLARIEGA